MGGKKKRKLKGEIWRPRKQGNLHTTTLPTYVHAYQLLMGGLEKGWGGWKRHECSLRGIRIEAKDGERTEVEDT